MIRPIRILHLITGLNTGGAEMVLARLVTHLDPQEFTSQVVSMLPPGTVAQQIRASGIHIESLEMSAGRITPRDIFRFVQLVRRKKPDIVQTWMYHADFLGGIGAKLAGKFPVVWGIHNSTVDRVSTKKSTRLIIQLCAALSGWAPTKIISVSQRAIDIHVKAGYKAGKFVFIPNGFDLQAFHPIPSAHSELCHSLNISENAKIVGLIARFDPQKDVKNFIDSAAKISKKISEARFILCGDNMTSANQELAKWIRSAGIQEQIYLLGHRNDIPKIMAGLDIAALSSYGEAFPLVLGEAMACGIPCVGTNVGDSAFLIGDTGRIVPPRDSEALAKAISDLLILPPSDREKLGKKARQRIKENFSLEQMVHTYSDLYKNLL
jgi:glycosyltransferase involved in cell wall biosynthesis